jgi:hypothetical protein
VPTTLFTSEEYAHISALLSCNSDAGNHPDTPDGIGSDFTLIHNPYARNPLPPGLLPSGREYIVENDHVVCHMRSPVMSRILQSAQCAPSPCATELGVRRH